MYMQVSIITRIGAKHLLEDKYYFRFLLPKQNNSNCLSFGIFSFVTFAYIYLFVIVKLVVFILRIEIIKRKTAEFILILVISFYFAKQIYYIHLKSSKIW